MNQIDATISQVYYLRFMYSSTCFGRPYAHHQEFNNFSSSLWLYLWSVVVAVLLVVVGPAVEVFSVVGGLLTNRPRLRTLPPPHSYGNQKLQRQFDGLLMMGIVMPETC